MLETACPVRFLATQGVQEVQSTAFLRSVPDMRCGWGADWMNLGTCRSTLVKDECEGVLHDSMLTCTLWNGPKWLPKSSHGQHQVIALHSLTDGRGSLTNVGWGARCAWWILEADL